MAFKCEKCDKEGFADGTKLRRHMRRAHATEVHMCSHCNKRYGSRDTLGRHLKKCTARMVLKVKGKAGNNGGGTLNEEGDATGLGGEMEMQVDARNEGEGDNALGGEEGGTGEEERHREVTIRSKGGDGTGSKEEGRTTEEEADAIRIQVEFLPSTSAQALKENGYRCHECPKEFGTHRGVLLHGIRKHQPELKDFCHYCDKWTSDKDDMIEHLLIHTQQQQQVYRQRYEKLIGKKKFLKGLMDEGMDWVDDEEESEEETDESRDESGTEESTDEEELARGKK